MMEETQLIGIEKELVHHIPVLHIAKKEHWEEALPLIIFVHGFTSAKEHNLHYAYLLADKGYRVLMPDVLYHGERGNGAADGELQLNFWGIVLNTISELDLLKEHYIARKLVLEDRIGLAGTSMGAIITLGALTHYRWIKAAVSLMGNPCYEQFASMQITEMKKRGIEIPLTEEELANVMGKLKEMDLSLQPKVLAGRPLLFWHGRKDTVVPFADAYSFFEQVKKDYAGEPEKIHFIEDERAGHKVSREGLLATVSWFEKYV